MWNNKIPEIISERPEEEDKESYKNDESSQHTLKKQNKINKILDSHKNQSSDYNSLFKENKKQQKQSLHNPYKPIIRTIKEVVTK